MKKLFIISIAACLASCSGYQYVSSPQYVPLHEKKGEVVVNLSKKNAQVGYAITNNLSVFATGYQHKGKTVRFSGKENSGEARRSHECYEVNVGTGYFRTSNRLVYEVLVGGGFGKMKYTQTRDWWPDDYQFDMSSDRINFYIQPNFGFIDTKYFELGVFTRFNYYRYDNLKTSVIMGGNETVDERDQYFMNRQYRNLFFVEPGVVFRGGTPLVKFQTTLSSTLNIKSQDLKYRYVSLNFSLFVNVAILKQQKDQ